MKLQNLPLYFLLGLSFQSCKNEPTNYTITKVNPQDCSSMYNDEASKFLDKKVSLKFSENAVKMSIEGQPPIFLKYRQKTFRTDGLGQKLGDVIEYSNDTNGNVNLSYELAIDKNNDGTTELEITKIQLGTTTPCSPGPSFINTYIKAKQ